MAFYQCSKCKKRWHYPLKKCLECFSVIEKISSQEIKIVGISKVNVPTILHPKVPYFVLVMEDDHGNRWVEKSSKEYRIGKTFKREVSKSESRVALSKFKYDIDECIIELINLLGGLDITSSTKILILPTLISPSHSYFAVNTSPKVLGGLIRYLIKLGGKPQNIKVAAQSFDETPIEASAEKSKLLEVCVKNKITPLDLAKTNFTRKGEEEFVFEVSEEVFSNNIIINLPVLKLDSNFKVKGALENTIKFLKKESYLSLKYLHDDFQIIEKLQGILPRHLTIADGITVQKTTNHTSFVGLMMGSFNPFNLDRVFSEIAMLKDLPNYLDKININDIPVVGRRIEELQYDIEKVGT